MTATQIERTASQFEAQPIPDESQLVPELTRLFGEHTFFLGSAGLHIIDAAEPTKAGVPAGRVVKLASWTDSHGTALAPHEPQYTDRIIELDKAA